MKHNLYVKGTMIILLSFLLSIPLSGHAENEDVNVKPNEYREKDIKLNTDYLHEDSFYQQREQLSEDQLLLKFEGDKPKQTTLLAEDLFKEDRKGTNTITAKSEQLEITFQNNLNVAEEETASQTNANQTFLITGLFAGAILLGIGALIYLIPKTIQ